MRGSLGATAFSIGSVVLLLLGIPFLAGDLPTAVWPRFSPISSESAGFVYLSRIIMSTHPFIALGMTESLITSGGNPFTEVVQLANSGRSISVPSPVDLVCGHVDDLYGHPTVDLCSSCSPDPASLS